MAAFGVGTLATIIEVISILLMVAGVVLILWALMRYFRERGGSGSASSG